jgi:hypothetical protein
MRIFCAMIMKLLYMRYPSSSKICLLQKSSRGVVIQCEAKISLRVMNVTKA